MYERFLKQSLFLVISVSVVFTTRPAEKIKKSVTGTAPYDSYAFKSVALQQTQIITGKVTSQESGQPLPGVNVIIKGANRGILTDFDGNYSIPMPEVEDDVVLQFSYLGMTSVEVIVGSQDAYDVVMQEALSDLSEVVITTALGLRKQAKSLGYSQQTVTGVELEEAREPNVFNALTGRVAGVQITQSDGGAGGTTSIIIRGGNNIGTGRSDQPLIILDGTPIYNNDTNINGDSGRDWGSGINAINSQDIEEFVVLKGPNAAALYGADAANGVILITTKSGKAGQGLGVSYDYTFKQDEAYGFREVQNIYGIGNDGWKTKDIFPTNDDGDKVPQPISFWGSGGSWGPKMDGTIVRWYDGELRPYDPQPDNLKQGFINGYTEQHSLSFSGGSEKGTFRVSVSDLKSNPIYPNSEYDRQNISVNGSLSISDKITVRSVVNYIKTERLNAPLIGDNGNGFGKALLWNWARSEKFDIRLANYKNEDGSINEDFDYGRDGRVLWETFERFDTRLEDRIIGSLSVNWQFTDWLNLMIRSGIDNLDRRRTFKLRPRDIDGLLGKYNTNLGRDRILKNEFLFTSTNKINDDITLSTNFGGSEDSDERYGLNLGRDVDGFSNPNIYSLSNARDANHTRARENFFNRKKRSLYGTIDVSYKDYLFLQVTGRNDWSSTLPEDSNSYFYPSGSASFVFTDAFSGLTDNNFLSSGKFRVSWARASVDAAPFQLEPTYSTSSWEGLPTASVGSTLPPLALRPQHTASFETGLDMVFLNNRLSLSATYYSKSSTNQLLAGPIPITSGYSRRRYNSGELSNKGFELTLNAFPINTGKFKWEVLFNYYVNENKVEQLDTTGGVDVLQLGGQWGNNGPAIEAREGESYGSIMGWDYIRDEETGKILVGEDGEPYNTPHRVKLGDATPKWYGGLVNTFTYKGFTLNSVIDIKWGGDMWFGSKGAADAFGQTKRTLYGRNRENGGLEWTDDDGNVRNDGLIIENALVSPKTPEWIEETDDKPGHYKYTTTGENTKIIPARTYHGAQASSWGAGNITTNSVHENTWVRLTELSIGYNLPRKLVSTLGVQNVSFNIFGRNLFFLYKTAPDNLNPAGGRSPGKLQGIEFASLPYSRQFGVNFKISL